MLVTPSILAAGIEFSDDEWFAAMAVRSGEPWYDEALAAIKRLNDGEASDELITAAAPLMYGRWTEQAREHVASGPEQRNTVAGQGFFADGAFGDAEQTRAALSTVDADVLVLGGGLDPAPTERTARELAHLFPRGRAVIQPGAGHYPWLDDQELFVGTVTEFLD